MDPENVNATSTSVQEPQVEHKAAEHQTVYAEIDHTKKGPIPAPPVELFDVQYTSVRGAGQQELATLGHSCECRTATT